MRNFRKLEVWNEARLLVKEIYLITSKLPLEEKFGLTSQINRCSISIAANIAEGSAKDSQKDFIRFLQISLGSAYELESHLILCGDLNFLSEKELNLTIKKLQVLQRRISALKKYNQSKL
ncbi:four helix bundle protein [Tenacibaculum haliotis]|uniref:four helix bundle protein n=1 Tax=Tenacibaculum haliotis TaxID=1888914 RepID=UPI0021AF4F59|nr:four helix bundle protein [Tenacibaculum haliotis]MCT4699886.1 four helix bundle protein [Tenacibaculum haliotis]